MKRNAFEFSATSLKFTYDVAVIGAGVVGLFLVAQLARAGLRVALIEGGDEVSNTLTNAKHTELYGRDHSSTKSGRAMGLGGTSVLWGGQLSELSTSDIYESEGWPINHIELCELYERTYTALGLPARPSYQQARSRFGGDEGTLGEVERIFSYWLPNPNFATLFRRHVIDSPNVKVLLNAKATGFCFDSSGRTIGVDLRSPEGAVRLRASQYIVAAGVIESNRLLLAAQSNEGCPWARSRLLGSCFQDHLGGEIGNLRITDESKFRDFFETGFVQGVKLMPKLRFCASQKQERVGASSISAFPSYHSNMTEHIQNIKSLAKSIRTGTAYAKWTDLPSSIWTLGQTFAPLIYRYAVQKRVFALFDRGVRLAVQCNQCPTSKSRISIEAERLEPDGLPRVCVDWQIDGDEARTLRRAAVAFQGYFKANRLAVLTLDPQLEDAESYIHGLSDTSHPSGGIIMSTDSNLGVTDRNALIWGSTNTYVAGASVLPSSGEANVTLTALAFTLRLSDHLISLYAPATSISST